jgi:hypothetical protein
VKGLQAYKFLYEFSRQINLNVPSIPSYHTINNQEKNYFINIILTLYSKHNSHKYVTSFLNRHIDSLIKIANQDDLIIINDLGGKTINGIYATEQLYYNLTNPETQESIVLGNRKVSNLIKI